VKIICVVGTRPEAIKMAPIIQRLKKESWADTRVLATAQHREMLDQVLDLFGIKPDTDLDIMRANQSLAELTSRLMSAVDKYLMCEMPDIVLAQGDTTTVFVVALACFYRNIRFGHVEAGLRTGDLNNPFPEEANRVLVSRLAYYHFAPTIKARDNLLREGYSDQEIYTTGNTVIDALLDTASKNIEFVHDSDNNKRMILVTAHRRENFGKPFLNICRAIKDLADQFMDLEFVYPVHPNPNILDVATKELGNHPRIHLIEPLDYGPFVSAMKKSYLILTDSGGVQEEAPALGKPVLVFRSETERPEAVEEGVVKLVGTDREVIVAEATQLLTDSNEYSRMAKGVSPYGDGHAAERIINVIKEYKDSL